MSCIDLSAAFDEVHVKLLIKRFLITGLSQDIFKLSEIWLDQRYNYVSLDHGNSLIHTCGVGTVKGLILDPILDAILSRLY